SIPNMKREFSMMGLELTSVSLIIHEDGSVTYMTWARAKSGGIENRTSHEPYQYDKRLIVSESDSLSDIIKNMAGVLNSAELNLGYRRILELS
ncbi:MAG: hypothetical protein FWB91_08690, partial [Defluviitaleaceae bacterium]|nr:hypothetical protein [Defluviitaleaceae bacterium]